MRKFFSTERQQGSSDKFAKRATGEFFSALFLLLVGSGPNSWIERLGSSSLVSSRKTALQLNRTKTLKPGLKKRLRHLIYAQTCVNKDFVHNGTIGLI